MTTDELRGRLNSVDAHARELNAKVPIGHAHVKARYRDALMDAITELEARDREIDRLHDTIEMLESLPTIQLPRISYEDRARAIQKGIPIPGTDWVIVPMGPNQDHRCKQ